MLELLKRALIKEVVDKKEKYIMLTENGFKFIERYKTIIDFIEEFDL
jgi:predicted transcriptional regulator